jgi:hypothetical protein
VRRRLGIAHDVEERRERPRRVGVHRALELAQAGRERRGGERQLERDGRLVRARREPLGVDKPRRPLDETRFVDEPRVGGTLSRVDLALGPSSAEPLDEGHDGGMGRLDRVGLHAPLTLLGRAQVRRAIA